MPDYYEINVALKGYHLFATAPRSIKDTEEMKRAYDILKNKFPKSEGYSICVTYWKSRGQIIDEVDKYISEQN